MREIDRFEIVTDKPCYFAGETLRANVHLRTRAPIKCRNVRADCRGEGHCSFVTGSGDNREVRRHTSSYWRETHTLWGPFHRTEEIQDAGTHAIFGSPWAPNEGVMHIPIRSKDSPIIVRVMDEDYGKRDDLLGEVLVASPAWLVEQSQAGTLEVTLPLMRNCKPEMYKNGQRGWNGSQPMLPMRLRHLTFICAGTRARCFTQSPS
jgi:hypothetical protein